MAGGSFAHIVAGEALVTLGRLAEAEEQVDLAERMGDPDVDLRPALAELLNRIAGKLEESDVHRAGVLYKRSWRIFPHPERNRKAYEMDQVLRR